MRYLDHLDHVFRCVASAFDRALPVDRDVKARDVPSPSHLHSEGGERAVSNWIRFYIDTPNEPTAASRCCQVDVMPK